MTQRQLRRAVTVACALAICLVAPGPRAIRAEGASITGTVTVSPLQITLDLSATQASTGTPVRANATVVNVGPVRVIQLVVTLRMNTTGLQVKGDLAQTIARLRSGQSGSITWTICGVLPATYVLMASVSVGGNTIDSEAHLLTITPGKKSKC